eukprot:Clim_evm111s172 gene=Clim_evmTU111s172
MRVISWLFVTLSVAVIGVLAGPGVHVTDLTDDNFSEFVNEFEITLVVFYADWCKFSKQLEPVFEDTALQGKERFQSESVGFGRVDCELQKTLAKDFGINKYPTIKVFRHGVVGKREYKGSRKVESFLDFVTEQLDDKIAKPDAYAKASEVIKANADGTLIGFFESTETEEQENFETVAHQLLDDCDFMVVTDNEVMEGLKGNRMTGRFVNSEGEPEGAELSRRDLKDVAKLRAKVEELCIPFLREVTFQNVEYLVEEGLPFLIMFYNPQDKEAVQRFEDALKTAAPRARSKFNYLYANGYVFSHPLMHLGRNVRDLPVIAIDSFKHMYEFGSLSKLEEDPSELTKFIGDFEDGSLHRKFHANQADMMNKLKNKGRGARKGKPQDAKGDNKPNDDSGADPLASTFKDLGPAGNRYSFQVHRDEL